MEVVDTLAAVLAIVHDDPKAAVTTAGCLGNRRRGGHQVTQEGRILRGGQRELGDGLLGDCTGKERTGWTKTKGNRRGEGKQTQPRQTNRQPRALRRQSLAHSGGRPSLVRHARNSDRRCAGTGGVTEYCTGGTKGGCMRRWPGGGAGSRSSQRTDEDVDGRLRVHVLKRQALVVLVDDIRRDLLADDLGNWATRPRHHTSQPHKQGRAQHGGQHVPSSQTS